MGAATILALVVAASAAASQPFQPPQHAGAPAQDTKPDNRGTKDAPLSVEIKSMPERSPEERAEHAAESQEKASTDRWIIGLTGIIATFTIVLAVATGFLWKATRDLVRGAERDARAIERAYFFAEPFMTSEALISDGAPTKNEFKVRFVNHGKSPAEINLIRAYCVVQSEVPQEIVFPDDGKTSEIPDGFGIAQQSHFDTKVEAMISSEQLSSIRACTTGVYIVGLVKYKDIFGEGRETGFCWHTVNTRTDSNPKDILVPTSESRLNKHT